MTLSCKILDKNNSDLNERHLLHFLDAHNYFKWNLVVHRYLRATYYCYKKKKEKKKKERKKKSKLWFGDINLKIEKHYLFLDTLVTVFIGPHVHINLNMTKLVRFKLKKHSHLSPCVCVNT